jgi:fused signal recognition particle receptor
MGWLSKLADCFKKTSSSIEQGIKKVVSSQKLDHETLEFFEEALISADVGVHVAKQLTNDLAKERFIEPINYNIIAEFLQKKIAAIVKDSSKTLTLPTPKSSDSPHVVMICGVNGSGKTTTIGKLVSRLQKQEYSITLGCCDTFRAAAQEQLSILAEKTGGCHIVTGQTGADPGSVTYTTINDAIKNKSDLVLLDTAGRLHNNQNLMEELNKCVKVVKKFNPEAPHEIILVIDGTTGQNANSQIELFHKMLKLSGLIITKLDGSSKGGMIINIAQKYDLPIYAIGTGESLEDLQNFDADLYSQAIVNIS